MIRRALGCIARLGPSTDQDRWEENNGLNALTLATCIAALVAGGSLLEERARHWATALADFWNAHLEDWMVAYGSDMAKEFGVAGYYVRTSPASVISDGKGALDELVPYAHWITPEGMPKRFDTWFFLAAAPPDQLGAHDGKESTDSIWVSPREALEGGQTGRFKLPFPTTRNLIKLGKQVSVKAALDDSRGKHVVTVTPILTKTATGRMLRIPLEAGYDGDVFEVGSLGFTVAGLRSEYRRVTRRARRVVEHRFYDHG